MIVRKILPVVEKALNRQAAVALLGPRQVGKTTLALEISKTRDSIYLDLQDLNDRNKLSNPSLFFENVREKLVILDEIHRMPEIFETLRGVIDKGRQNGHKTGRFLILGSASIDLLRQSSETLAGRISYIDMSPLSILEIDSSLHNREKLWLRGGFPESYLASSDIDSFEIRKDFIRTYLERDIPMFGPRVPSTTLERLWTMLAHRQGSILNSSELARSLEISAQSVTRYIDLLVDLLLVRRLQPYHLNVGKRLIKSPKIYLRDSGLVHALLGIKNFEDLAGHPVMGMSWEGFALETLLSVVPWNFTPYFYRTSTGTEIDLIIERPDRSIWAIEIKRGLSAKPSKGFYDAFQDLNPSETFLVHSGDGNYPLSENIQAIGLIDLAQKLTSEDSLSS